MPSREYAIELAGISKYFGEVAANDSIDLAVKRGEILALLGENGSGKTTLMNMLSGIYMPDAGSIYLNGEKIVIHSPEDAKRFGIGMIHQHFKLVENFTAADNIWIGADGESVLLSDKRFEIIEAFGKKYGFEIDSHKYVYEMSVSEKQTIEIIKVLYYGADILILDEPTAVLTLQETRKLFRILRKMRDQGCAIIIITHKLNEVLEISDRVTILRKGKSVGTVLTDETNVQELTELMVGKTVELSIDRPYVEPGEVLLEIKDLNVVRDDASVALQDVSFSLKSGEILGVAGVSGCGQKELCEAIAGLQKTEAGSSIIYKSEHIEGKSPREIIERGISMSFIPEDRLGMGLAASLGITDNMMLKSYIDSKGPFVDRKAARDLAKKVIRELEIVTPNTETPVRRLSGGNVQKVLLGREMQANPSVIVTAYPVRGLDINSSYLIYNILNEQKQKGAGILFVGEDLDVMLELCDRIVVLCHGRVNGIVDADKTSKEELGLLMTDAAQKADNVIRESAAAGESSAPQQKERIQENTDTKKKKLASVRCRQPFVRIAKKGDLSLGKSILLYTLAILFAIFAGGLFILLIGQNPFSYYKTVVNGCFSNAIYIKGFIRIIIPLIITSLGISVAFKMRFWNIGANGQFIIGAISAATVALLLGDGLPQWLTLLIMLLAGAVGGGLFGLVVAVFKVKFNTSETLLTLMFNYIAYYFLTYLKNLMFYRKLSDTGAVLRPDFKQLPENTWMFEMQIGKVTFDISLFIAVFVAALLFIYSRHTKQGYEISVVGDSQNTARYAGMNVNKIILRTMFLSAAVIGVAGMLHVSGSGTSHSLSDGITNDVGWTGIIVAWLAKLNPVGIVIASVLFGVLQKGTAIAESTFHISSAASSILQGIILFSVLAADFFVRYKIVFQFKREKPGKGGM